MPQATTTLPCRPVSRVGSLSVPPQVIITGLKSSSPMMPTLQLPLQFMQACNISELRQVTGSHQTWPGSHSQPLGSPGPEPTLQSCNVNPSPPVLCACRDQCREHGRGGPVLHFYAGQEGRGAAAELQGGKAWTAAGHAAARPDPGYHRNGRHRYTKSAFVLHQVPCIRLCLMQPPLLWWRCALQLL